MVNLFGVFGFGKRDGLPGVLMQLNGLLIHAYNRMFGVVRSGIHFKDILHRGHESGLSEN